MRQHAEDYNDPPTKKPVELMEHLVKLVTHEKSTVLDPFMGSGSMGIAALALHRAFDGFEQNKGYFDIAGQRLQNALA